MALTAKQQRFVDEYLVDFNGTQAAIRAGYSEKTAHAIAWENLRKPEISAALKVSFESISKRVEITQEYVLTRLRENAERALQNQPVLNKEGKETGEYRYEGSVANRALELLGKHLGLFPDKFEHTGKDGESMPMVTVFLPSNSRSVIDGSDTTASENGRIHAEISNGNGKHK